MNSQPVNVSRTYLPPKEKYLKYIDEIYSRGWITNGGVCLNELEKRLKEYLNAKYILSVSNGTLALQLTYKMMGLTGEVITTPFTFVATASSMIWEGLEPVFVDIDPKTLTINADLIEEKITDKTSAIVAVHTFGIACDVEKIDKIAKKYNLKVIYDAAHAFAIRRGNESILSWGNASTLSFHATKTFHTIEGGAIVTDDETLYQTLKLSHQFGLSNSIDIVQLGINAKMNEMQAAMGLCVLDDIDKIIENKKQSYFYYKENLEWNKDLFLPEQHSGWSQNYNYFPVIFNSKSQMLKVIEDMNRCNIFPRRYFYPSLHTLPYIKKEYNLPFSSSITERILCLPIFCNIDKAILCKIVSIVNARTNRAIMSIQYTFDELIKAENGGKRFDPDLNSIER